MEGAIYVRNSSPLGDILSPIDVSYDVVPVVILRRFTIQFPHGLELGDILSPYLFIFNKGRDERERNKFYKRFL